MDQNSKQVLYVVPGFRESVDSREAYRSIEKIFKSKGFTVRQVPIKWQFGTMLTYGKDLKDFVKKHHKKNEKIYLLGFSFGAMISLISAKDLKAQAIILCSLSPYFSTDLKSLPKKWRSNRVIGKKRLEVFKKLDFNKITNNFNIKTFILYGTKEAIQCHTRAILAHKRIKKSKLISVTGAKHDIGDSNYLNEISKISKIL